MEDSPRVVSVYFLSGSISSTFEDRLGNFLRIGGKGAMSLYYFRIGFYYLNTNISVIVWLIFLSVILLKEGFFFILI